MKVPLKTLLLAVTTAIACACDQSGSGSAKAVALNPPPPAPGIQFRRSGTVAAGWLREISGIQASRSQEGVYWVHNDDKDGRLGAIDLAGEDLGHVSINGVHHRDWEDITLIPGAALDLLVLANTGDNKRHYDDVGLIFIPEPRRGADGRFGGAVSPIHQVRLTYPDERHDTEAVSYDPVRRRLLFLTKRSAKPQLYSLELNTALSQREAQLEFLGEIHSLRAPETGDRAFFGKRTKKISQPTGLDISPDGRRAAVITYRSLYLFNLPESGDWLEGLQGEATEVFGPPAKHEEAVTFTADGTGLVVTSEGKQAPVYEFRLESF